MVRSLSVFYLRKSGSAESRRLSVIECGLNDAFRDFCRETFDASAPLDYPPLKLVVAADGVDAVHGLFCRGGHAPYFVEVLNHDEESRVGWVKK